MKQCMDADNLHRRLKKIIGQVQTIDRMVDEDVPCEDILAQINAAKSALHGCGKVVLEGHIKHCVRDGIEHGDADKTIENFTKAVERFSNMGWAGDKPSHALVFSRIARKKRSSFVLLLSFCALYSLHPHMYNKPIPPMVQKVVTSVKLAMEKLKHFLELGGTKKDIALLVISGVALIVSIFDLVPLPFDASWAAIILCGIPIILEAVIGLVTAFDIKANVLVSLALIASVCIGEDFTAGEVAFIMQLGGLLEELTVARAGQRHRRGRRGYRARRRRSHGAAAPHRALQAHDAHHQAQYNILAHAQLHRHRARHHRHTEPCCRRAGP